jgi:hypothetical protein
MISAISFSANGMFRATSYLSDSPLDNGNLIETFAIFQNDANYLVAHSRFRFGG